MCLVYKASELLLKEMGVDGRLLIVAGGGILLMMAPTAPYEGG
jgi:hypothetical protein